MSGSFNYARSQATASRLIAKFGKKQNRTQLIEPGSPTGPAFNPTPGAPVPHDVDAVEIGYDKTEIDGTRIQQTDKHFLIAYVNMTNQPNNKWILKVKSKGDAVAVNYKIIDIKPLEPGDLVLLWNAQCRAS